MRMIEKTPHNKKRILIFISSYYPLVGGAEVAIREIARRLSDSFEFDLITARLDEDWLAYEEIENVHVHRVGFGGRAISKILSPFLGMLKVFELKKKYAYQSFWPMMITYTCGAAYLANMFSKERVPIVLTLQEGDSEKYLKTKWLGLIDLSWKLALKRTDMLTTISTYLRGRAHSLGYKGESEIVRNGVAFDHFTKTQVTWSEKHVRLITTSRLVEKNAVDQVIRALTLLPEHVVFQVLGTGPLERDLKILTEELGLSKRVEFVGFVDHKEMPEYLQNAHLYIRPSRSEGLGVSFMEAMAAELPVIATAVGGIPDFLTDYETGIFCEVDNPDSIAEAVLYLIDNKSAREDIVQKAKELMKKEYDWDEVALQMARIFSKVGK